MEDRLKYTLQFVNDWLKFSEAKNAALVALVAVILSKFSTSLWDQASGLIWWCNALGVWSVTAGGILSLMSFIPKLTFKWTPKTEDKDATDNLFYFGHISKFSAFDYLDSLYAAETTTNPNKKLEIDLAGQIVINSQIAVKKYRQFTLAACVALGGFFMIGIAMSATAIKGQDKGHSSDGEVSVISTQH